MGSLIGSTFRNALCTEFDGSAEYMDILDPSFKANTAGAWSFWVRLDAVFGSNGSQFCIGYGDTSGSNNAVLHIHVRRATLTGTGTYIAILNRATNGGQNHGYSATTTALSANTWYHVVFQSDGSTWTCYINDVAQTLTNWFGAGSTNNGNWYGDVSGTNHRLALGAAYTSGNVSLFFDGRLDEMVYMAGRVLSSAEITALYNGGVRRNPYRIPSLWPDIVTWYRMGDSQDSATTVFDEIGANDLTLQGGMNASNYIAP